MPALYNLAAEGHLDPGLTILGVDHNDGSDEGWRAALSATMQSFTKDDTGEFHTDRIDPSAWGFIEQRLHYVKGDFGDPATFSGLASRIEGDAIFYLAVSARFFGPVAEALGAPACCARRRAAFAA
jgi:glucose-6-phosphate 1-dehydrogenase